MSFRDEDMTLLKQWITFHFAPGTWAEIWGLEITESIVIGTGTAECLAKVPRPILAKT